MSLVSFQSKSQPLTVRWYGCTAEGKEEDEEREVLYVLVKSIFGEGANKGEDTLETVGVYELKIRECCPSCKYPGSSDSKFMLRFIPRICWALYGPISFKRFEKPLEYKRSSNS
ncbi:hypothetical protein LENED_012264 [Lentinula edodes]|uniref:Uncharacterized protein n=1 Tax=Lentinula edodes TaxID=5353 RepID=A0A1Q3ES59_LENED|nr:hypothetical protein LENED_012264 [Lentinula edodes]